MSDLLKILQETADPDSSKLAKILDLGEEDVEKKLRELKESGVYWVGFPCFTHLKVLPTP